MSAGILYHTGIKRTLQLKVFIGLGVMLLTISLIPVAADFIFEQMKVMVVAVVKACGGG